MTTEAPDVASGPTRLRPVTEADRDAVRAWRNHPEVRRVSLNQGVIGPEEHQRYWDSLATDATRRVLIYERDGMAAGVVTFFDLQLDDPEPSAMWGYFLDNDGLTERGALMPAWIDIQRKAVRYAFGDLGVDVLYGEVLDSNDAVRRMNTRNKFVEYASQPQTINGDQVVVHRIRRDRQPADPIPQ